MAKTIETTDEVAWSLFKPPIRVGDRIRALAGPHKSGTVAEGEVIRIGRGYRAHACPDHHEAPDCTCGGDSDWVEAMQPYPVVDFPDYVVTGRLYGGTKCVSPEDEGERWERIHA